MCADDRVTDHLPRLVRPIDATKGRVPLGTRQTRLPALIFSSD
jgi:hypothetical protein